MTTLLQLTYSGLFLAIFAQQVGLPIPSVVFLIAAGALAAHGKMNPAIIVALGILGCLAGDGLWFWIGRKWGSKALRVLCQFTADPRSCSKNAQRTFRRHGLPVLCVACLLYTSIGTHVGTCRGCRSRFGWASRKCLIFM